MIILSGITGNGYVTSAREINGYIFKKCPENAIGFFYSNPQGIIY
ncbi:MucBP domain-containing protein [Lactobacillus apis]|nr:MucBP domain-containing protein [Lactobacillus apis]GGG38034.1 hypothetical protein GCM10007323_10190 [Lactobacillus apis]